MSTSSTLVTPGHALGRAATVLWIVWPVGLAVSVVAIVRSVRAGRVSRPALVGLVLALLAGAATVALLLFLANGLGGLAERCAQLGPGEYSFDDGSSLSCG